MPRRRADGITKVDLLRTGPAGWLRLIIWLAPTSLGALASVRVLRPSREESPHD